MQTALENGRPLVPAIACLRSRAEGKRISIEYDEANAAIGHKDRYGRTLAYVFLPGDTLLNAEIIRQGYGQAFTRSPSRVWEEFRRLEQEAREHRRGLWASSSS